MWAHYCKVAIRQIRRNLFFSSINMLGFVLGMTGAFLIYLWVVDEMTFEDFHSDAERIYRVVEVKQGSGGQIEESVSTIGPLAGFFRTNIPQVESATFWKMGNISNLEGNNKNVSGVYVYADTTFFDMFTFPVLSGNPQDIKKDPYHLVLTDLMSIKLFGTTDVIGQQVYRMEQAYKVVAVIHIPRKSHIRFDFLLNADSYPGESLSRSGFRELIHAYVKMRPGSYMSPDEQKTMSHALANLEGSNTLLRFQPITDIHLKTGFDDPTVWNHGSMAIVYLFIALALLVIFMGAFNFMTLSMARASLRYKEIGVRKVTGAKQRTLIVQFLSESMIQSVIPLVLALALTELLLPLFNSIMDKDMVLQVSWSVVAFLFFGIVGVGCLAGSYPAFYLSSVNPLLSFKGGMKTGKKGGLIRILVCVQFVIAITLILVTSLVFKQLNYMENKDIGVRKDNIISIWCNLWYDVDNFKQEVLKNPNVISVSMGREIHDYLGGIAKPEDMVKWYNENGEQDSMQMICIYADGDFTQVFGIDLLKGEFSDPDAESYWGRKEMPVLINETAWKAMKVPDPVGMSISHPYSATVAGRIKGVVKDFNFQSLHEQIKPVYLLYSPEAMTHMLIRIAPENKQETLQFLKQKYEEMAPMFVKEFKYTFFADALDQNYAEERQQSRMLFAFALLAITIAIMGVLGLVSLSTAQRTKEIGIRKVNGAHADRIVRMFCKEYLQWVGIAFVIACPLGYYLASRWLEAFAYRTPISWWLFPLAGLVVAVVTLIAVLGQTWRAASRNPVRSLRYE